jgi:hypothetical protein
VLHRIGQGADIADALDGQQLADLLQADFGLACATMVPTRSVTIFLLLGMT